eukprot:182417-Alexandrium_andersonii.AAC.1
MSATSSTSTGTGTALQAVSCMAPAAAEALRTEPAVPRSPTASSCLAVEPLGGRARTLRERLREREAAPRI